MSLPHSFPGSRSAPAEKRAFPAWLGADKDPLKIFAFACVTASLLTGLVLLILHRNMGGPGDQIGYYRQASELIPFTHRFYGPGYMVFIRGLRDLFNIEWFLAGKLASWFATCAIFYCSYLILKRTVDKPTTWLGLSLLAINPWLISMSYWSLKQTFGAAMILIGVTSTLNAPPSKPIRWALPGLLFSLALLTRFQALGFLIGAFAGILLTADASLSTRAKSVGVLLLSAFLPVALWNAFLLATQGFIPENHNFIALTIPLGQYNDFFDTDGLAARFESTLGVLTSHWTVSFKLAFFSLKEFLWSPVRIGVPLLGLAAIFLVPGLIIISFRRNLWPFLAAFMVGLLLTGLGSRGWIHYYLAFLPWAVALVAVSLETLKRWGSPKVANAAWGALFLVTLIWTPGKVRAWFHEADWPEQTAAQRHIEASRTPSTLVSTTTRSFQYGTDLPFLDQSQIMRTGESRHLMERLRRHRVSHLVINRHTHWEFPGLKHLLEDSIPNLPPGLRRDTLILKPARLAIYEVIYEDEGDPGS